jgi:two-component system sensor histidine kinase/response regulator
VLDPRLSSLHPDSTLADLPASAAVVRPQAPGSEIAADPSRPRRPDAVLDRAAALACVDNDLQLLRSLIELFLEECPGLLAVIRSAIEGADAAALSRAAHTLKGSVGVFGAGAAVAAAQRLEAMAKWGHLTGAAAAYADLEQSIERVKPALVELGTESD